MYEKAAGNHHQRIEPVSYTHLDVYKRQHIGTLRSHAEIKMHLNTKVSLEENYVYK